MNHNHIILALSGLVFPVWADSYIQSTFDAFPDGNLTLTQVKTEWPGVTWDDGLAEERVAVFSGAEAQSGKSIRVTYPQGSFGPSQGGAQWQATFPSTHDTLMSSYWVRPSVDFDFVKGGKLPGLCGSQCNTGGNIPTGSDGWSARMMWRTGGKVVLYLYYPDQPGTYAVDFPLELDGNDVLFTPGSWSEIKTQVGLNTPGVKNGFVKVWYNGRQALDLTGLRLRDQDTMHVNRFYFSTFHGGNDATWAPSLTCTMDFDSFWVGTEDSQPSLIKSKERIGASLVRQGDLLLLPPSHSSWNIRWFDAQGKMLLQQSLPPRSGFVNLPKGLQVKWGVFQSESQSYTWVAEPR